MRRIAGFLWCLVVVGALIGCVFKLHSGIEFRSDLLSLLPGEERDSSKELGLQQLAKLSSKRVVLLVGGADLDKARSGATIAREALQKNQNFETVGFGVDDVDIQKVIRVYTEHASDLLSADDRNLLVRGEGDKIIKRALSQVYGGVGLIDSDWILQDPFLTLPSFLSALPRPFPNVALEDGMLVAKRDGQVWVLLMAKLAGDPMALWIQKDVERAITEVEAKLPPGIGIIKTGAIFFAAAGARTALQESETIGLFSALAIASLIVVMFRSIGPLALNLLAIAVGFVLGFGAVLVIFGEVHVITILLGTSLIGVAVDYGLYYCCERFSGEGNSAARITRILPALALGFANAAIGYALFLWSSFPGLNQIAAFSVFGLTGAFLTVVIWFPYLDRAPPRPLPPLWRSISTKIWKFWAGRHRGAFAIVILILIGLPGTFVFRVSDDIRKLQSLDPLVVGDQKKLQEITGFRFAGQMLIIVASSDEDALVIQEKIAPQLDALVTDRRLGNWQAPVKWLPSAYRQNENRELIKRELVERWGEQYRSQIGFPGKVQIDDSSIAIAPHDLMSIGLLSDLIPAPGTHLILLEDLRDPAVGRLIAASDHGLTFVDPAAELSGVLKNFRERALLLLCIAFVATTVLHVVRYGFVGGLQVLIPPTIAIALTPTIAALFGADFTLFSVLALILVLCIGVDYSIFSRETDDDHRDLTLLSVLLAGISSVLAFGMLAWSSAAAIQGFGLTMLIGTSIAIFLCPIVRKFSGQ